MTKQLALTVLACCGLLFAQSEPVTVSEHLEAGLAAGKAQKLDIAAEHFEAAIRLDPAALPAYVNLGAIRHLQGRYSLAVDALQTALDLDEAAASNAGARGMLGYGLVRTDRFEEAIPHLEIERKQAPGNPQLELGLALAYLRTSKLDDAVNLLRELNQKYSSQAEVKSLLTEALIARAESAVRRKNSREAIAAYNDVLSIAPEIKGIPTALGDLHFDNGEYETALRLFRTESDDERIGTTLLSLGRSDEAVAHLRKAAETSTEAKSRLGQALLDIGSTDEAEEVFLSALTQQRNDQTSARIHYQLARLYRAAGSRSKAANHLTNFRELQKALLEKD